MQTVNFYCPHCNNLMAVGTELLGHQVQCPTCHQVVIAPTAPAAAAPPASDAMVDLSAPASKEAQDSIFGEHVDEDLFGSSPPKVEIPADDAPISAPIAEAAPLSHSNFAVYPPGVPRPPEATPLEATFAPPPVTFEVTAPEPSAASPESAPTYWSGAGPDGQSAPAPEPERPAWSPSSEEMDDHAEAISARRRGPTQEPRRFASLMLTFFAPYSVVMTLVAGWYFYKSMHTDATNHPMANIPDIFAQYEPATRKQLSGRSVKMPDVDAPLPRSLLVKLNTPLQVGDLEVTPEKIEEGKVKVHTVTQDNQTIPSQLPGEALILHLKLKNKSGDIYFHPTDPVFDRKYDRRMGSAKPYDQIVVDGKHFYGGAIDVLNVDKRVRRRYVDGQDNDDHPLPPGEERHTLVCTDPQDVACLEAVKNHQGRNPIVWRVELRRGLTTFRGRELSVCAVVGVEFTPGDVQKARN